MISFNTNVLVYATAALADDRVSRARDVLARAMRATTSVLLLQILAEFSNVAIRKARIPANRRQNDDRSLARRPAGSVGR